MQKPVRIIALPVALMLILLLSAGLVHGQVGPDALKYCEEFAFSTEEDFVTQGPEPPDGNPIISDGDLLGPNCEVCARNYDLLHDTFDVDQDLGLDAADVIDVENYLVAFSTELDSPHGTFTAGDLLVTNGAIIANVALTHLFQVGYKYDIGLDALHFVGDLGNIIAFLGEIQQIGRDFWVQNPGALSEMLIQYDIDIWFSTEGTLGPVDAPAFLDGDLLSARYGIIVAPNKDLLPPSVPAGIPYQGVDFGLDAVTGIRVGDDPQIHFSTEILYQNEPSFTDGDMLKYGDGVVAKNIDLIQCFEPMAGELGLDALSVNIPITRPCESRITRIAGVDVADIGLDGMAMTGTVGSPAILAPVPFGGWIDIQGSICPDVDRFRVLYRLAGSANPWTPIPVEAARGWEVKVDAFFPPGPDCLGTAGWSSDVSGWYNASDYRNLTYPVLGGCNTDLALTVWNSGAAVNGGDELYEVVLETETALGVFSDTVRLVQLDNTSPIAELDKQPGTCDVYSDDDMPLMVTARITDTHFYESQLCITGDGYGTHCYTLTTYYDDPGDNLIETGTKNWPAFVDLHPVDTHHLDPNPVECGYTVWLTAWERTLWCKFNFPNNQAYHYPGHRHDWDGWTFDYTPTP